MNLRAKQSNSGKPDESEPLDRLQRAQLDELKSANAMLHELAWEIEEVEQRLQVLVAQREGPTDIFLEREINELKRRHVALEDQLIHQMLRADELAAKVETVQQQMGQRSASRRKP